MTVIQSFLTLDNSTQTSNTTETGQELFKVDDLEITKIPKVAIPTGNNSNLYLSNYLSGYTSDNSAVTTISLGFDVWFNGTQYSAVTMGADSYLVFRSGPYTHASSPSFTNPGSIPYDKIFICANTSNSSYRSSDNINTYGYNGPVKISSGTTPNRTVTLIYAGWQGTLSTPLVWSITFYEGGSSTNPSRIDLHMNTIRTGVSGFYDRNSKFKEFTPESNTGYTITTFPQTRTWTCPENVYEVSAVCVGGGGGSAASSESASGAGGGGLGWKNKIPVTPGNTYTVQIGKGGTRFSNTYGGTRAGSGGQSYFINSSTVAGNGGEGAIGANDTAGLGGSYIGEGGGNGGNGGTRNGSVNDSGGGGGAGGYSGNGGKGGDVNSNFAGTSGSAGSGGGAGGGGGSGGVDTSGCGGGVGVYGEGSSGSGGIGSSSDGSGGKGGSGGENASDPSYDDSPYVPSKPGDFGGGGAGSDNTAIEYEDGGNGAVRLIWGPRLTRKFPTRNTQDLYVTYQYIKLQITESRSSSSTQASGFKLFYNQSEILYSNSTPVTSSEGSNPENLIDPLTTTKFTSSSLSVDIVIDLESSKNINGYKWITANDDNTQDPKSWIIYGSNDNSNWTEIDRITNYTAPSDRETPTRMFYLPIIPR